MHPEMSLVFLTVFAGVGQGIFILLVVLDALFGGTGRLAPQFIYAAGVISLVFPLMGMAGSFFHLGNPQRGWKAIKMWKQSWLSREVIFLPAFIAFDFLYLLLTYTGQSDLMRLFCGFLGIVAAVGLFISSAMLYAAIGYIKEWATPFTPVNFTLFGITSGAAVMAAVFHFTGHDEGIGAGLANLLALLASFSLVFKALAFQHNNNIFPTTTLKNALGINNPHIRQTDMGAAYGHYNTTEYSYPMSKSQHTAQEAAVLVMAFFLPMLIAIFAIANPGSPLKGIMLVIGSILVIAGLIVERRLFFIQGNHVQNLYYDNYRMSGVRNPLASEVRAGTPQPTFPPKA